MAADRLALAQHGSADWSARDHFQMRVRCPARHRRCPASSGAPSSASMHLRPAQMRSSRAAKLLVKGAGMMDRDHASADIRAGSCDSTSSRASTPPVEAPMATSLPSAAREDGGRAARRRGVRAVAAAPVSQAARLAPPPSPSRPGRRRRSGSSSDGLATQSTAPSSSAWIVARGAACGQGRHHDDRHRAQPHHLFQKLEAVHVRHFDVERHDVGIERLDRLARLQRIGGLRRRPRCPGRAVSVAAIRPRMVAESSTTRTRTGFIAVPPSARSGGDGFGVALSRAVRRGRAGHALGMADVERAVRAPAWPRTGSRCACCVGSSK